MDEAATNFWQSFVQIQMSSRAIVELPQKPLSLLRYEEPFFYVRPVYYRLWDIISSQTGTCAADKHPHSAMLLKAVSLQVARLPT